MNRTFKSAFCLTVSFVIHLYSSPLTAFEEAHTKIVAKKPNITKLNFNVGHFTVGKTI